MSYSLFAFQETAVNTLRDKFFKSSNQTSVLYSPTGSGKTVMMIALMDRIISTNPTSFDYAFIWLTPGNGELEEQSWKNSSEKSLELKSQFLTDALTNGFLPNTATFINWELVKNSKFNIALKSGEKQNLSDQIKHAKEKEIHFVLIIDEEHRDQTSKAQKIIDLFDADKIIRVSATPLSNGPDKDIVRVNDEDVIAQGLITRQIALNQDVPQNISISDTVTYFLDLADQKRIDIRKKYSNLGKKINPLVLIQFPDEKAGNKEERNSLINRVQSYLIEGLGQKLDDNYSTVARWLSNDHMNIKEIEKNNSPINYLLMKQAISTGWDAPRAKILVKFRLRSDATFTLQTIGRIRRMPEQKHYDLPLLDNGYIYSDDPQYISDVMNKGLATKLVSFELNPESPSFNVNSIKPNANAKVTNEEVVRQFYNHLHTKYRLTKVPEKNKEILQKSGYVFGNNISQTIATSDDLSVDILENTLQNVDINIPINTDLHRLRLLDAEQSIMKPMHVNSPSDVNKILVELFSNRAAGIIQPPITILKNLELWAFIINNSKKIRADAFEMDSGIFSKQLVLFTEINEGRADIIPFKIPKVDIYATMDDEKYTILDKNIYKGYSTKNWVKQSQPEKEFELWMQESNDVRWFYRSKDRGEQYFSIVYGSKKEGFFPDYLVQGVDGFTYIIETKGADGENIDKYSEQKFNALSEYVKGRWSGNARFAFVRKNKKLNRLMYNNTQWDESVSDSVHWRPLEELFTFFN